jgi:hypothetical protein
MQQALEEENSFRKRVNTLARGFWLALARRQGHLDRLDICCILGMAVGTALGRDVAPGPGRWLARGTLLVAGSTLAVVGGTLALAMAVVVVGNFRILFSIRFDWGEKKIQFFFACCVINFAYF